MEVVRSRLGPNQVSQRRLCRVLGQSRSTQRYHRRKPDDDRRLIEELRRWCEWHPRFGSERVHRMLLGTGWRVNFKRVHRLAARVLVAHPGQLRLIYRSKDKNDRKDAERIAKLLYLGEVSTVHVPSLDVRTWRELINCRSQMIAKRTRAKNVVRSLLRSAGISPPRQPGLWTKQGLSWLCQPAVAAGSPAGRDRDAQSAIATHRTGIEPLGSAHSRGAFAAKHPGSWSAHGRSGGRLCR